MSRTFVLRCKLALLCLAGIPALPAAPTADPQFEFLYGQGELFPSMLVALTGDSPFNPGAAKPVPGIEGPPGNLGDPTGVIAVRVVNPAPNTPVKVTLRGTSLFRESTVAEMLPQAGSTYYLAPTVRWDTEKLAALKQPLANFVISAEVTVGTAPATEIYCRVVVHSVNDWLKGYTLRGTPFVSFETKYLLAAYVNENSPRIDREITQRAIREGYVTQFRGYAPQSLLLKRAAKVAREELAAIYKVFRTLGFKYSLAPQASYVAEPDDRKAKVLAQGIRLFGDAMDARQASATEAAALLAAVYRKLGLGVVLMLVRDGDAIRSDALLGVFELDKNSVGLKPEQLQESLLVIDTSVLGTEDFEKAVELGKKRFARDQDKLAPWLLEKKSAVVRAQHESDGYLWIDISTARQNGVLPIPEF